MIKAAAAKILSFFLSNYIDGINSDQLQMSLWNGIAKLENISIKSDALTSHHIPLTIKNGKMSLISLEFPWGRLDSQCCQLKFENIFAVTDVTGNALVSKDLEVVNPAPPQDSTQQQTQGSLFSGIATKVIDNVKVSLNNMHIRMELHVDNQIAAIGLMVKNIEVFSVDENDKPHFYNAQETLIRKKIIIRDLGVYIDPNANYIDTNDIFQSMTSTNHDFIIEPFTTDTILTVNKQINADQRFQVDFVAPVIKIVMNKLQYLGIQALSRQLHHFRIRRSFAHLGRPNKSVEEGTGMWWLYANKTALYINQPTEFDPSNALKVLRNRKKFVELCRQKNDKVKEMEDELGPSASILLRSYAEYVINSEPEQVVTEQEFSEIQQGVPTTNGPIKFNAKLDKIDVNFVDGTKFHMNLDVGNIIVNTLTSPTETRSKICVGNVKIENLARSKIHFKWDDPLKIWYNSGLSEKTYNIKIPQIDTNIDYKTILDVYDYLDSPKINETKFLAKKQREAAIQVTKRVTKVDVYGNKFTFCLDLLSKPLILSIENYKFVDFVLKANELNVKSDRQSLIYLSELYLEIDPTNYYYLLKIEEMKAVLSSDLISQIIDFLIQKDLLKKLKFNGDAKHIIYSDIDIQSAEIDLMSSKVISTIKLTNNKINVAKGVKYVCNELIVYDDASNKLIFTNFDFDLTDNFMKVNIPILTTFITHESINNYIDFVNKTKVMDLKRVADNLSQNDKILEETDNKVSENDVKTPKKLNFDVMMNDAKLTFRVNENTFLNASMSMNALTHGAMINNLSIHLMDYGHVFSPLFQVDFINFTSNDTENKVNIGAIVSNLTRREIDVLKSLSDLKFTPLHKKIVYKTEKQSSKSKNLVLSHGEIKLSICYAGVDIKPPLLTIILAASGTVNEHNKATIEEQISILTQGLISNQMDLMDQVIVSMDLDFENDIYSGNVGNMNVFIPFNFLLGLKELIFSKDYYNNDPIFSISNKIRSPIEYSINGQSYSLDVDRTQAIEAELTDIINIRVGNDKYSVVPKSLNFPMILSDKTAVSLTSNNGRKMLNIISPYVFRNCSSLELNLLDMSGAKYSVISTIKPFSDIYLPFSACRENSFCLVSSDYQPMRPPTISLMRWNTCTEYYIYTKRSRMKCIIFFETENGLGLVRIVPNYTFINEMPIPIRVKILPSENNYFIDLNPGEKCSLMFETDLILRYKICATGFLDSESGSMQTFIDTHTKDVLEIRSADGLRKTYITVKPEIHEEGITKFFIYADCIFMSAISELLMASTSKNGVFSMFTDICGWPGFLFGKGEGIMNNAYIKLRDHSKESCPISVLNIGDRKTIFLPRNDSNLFFPLSYLVDDAPPQFKHANILIISYALSICNKTDIDFEFIVENSEKSYIIQPNETVNIKESNEKLSFVLGNSQIVFDQVGKFSIFYKGKIYEMVVVEKHYGLQAILSELSHRPPLSVKNTSGRMIRIRQKGFEEFTNVLSMETKPFALLAPFSENLIMEVEVDDEIFEFDMKKFDPVPFSSDLRAIVKKSSGTTIIQISESLDVEKTVFAKFDISQVNVSFISPRLTELMVVQVGPITSILKGSNLAQLTVEVENLRVFDMFPKAVFPVVAANVRKFLTITADIHLHSPKDIISSKVEIGCVNTFIDLSFIEEFYDYLSPVIHHPRKFPPALPEGSIEARLKNLSISQIDLIFTLRTETSRPRMARRFPEELALIPDVTTVPLGIKGFNLTDLSGRPTTIFLRILDTLKLEMVRMLPRIIGRADILFNTVGIHEDTSISAVLRGGEGFVKSVSNYVGKIGGSERKSGAIAMTPEDAVMNGLKSLASGIKHGLTGIVEKPLQGAKRGGFVGGLKGLASGIAGAVAKPVSGVLDAGAGIIGGAARALDESLIYSINYSEIKTPRVFLENHEDIIDKLYKQKCAEGSGNYVICVSPLSSSNMRIMVFPKKLAFFTQKYGQLYVAYDMKPSKLSMMNYEGDTAYVKYKDNIPAVIKFDSELEAKVFIDHIKSVQKASIYFK